MQHCFCNGQNMAVCNHRAMSLMLSSVSSQKVKATLSVVAFVVQSTETTGMYQLYLKTNTDNS